MDKKSDWEIIFNIKSMFYQNADEKKSYFLLEKYIVPKQFHTIFEMPLKHHRYLGSLMTEVPIM